MCICFNDALRQWTRPEAAETRETALRAWGEALREAAAPGDDRAPGGRAGADAEGGSTPPAACPAHAVEDKA